MSNQLMLFNEEKKQPQQKKERIKKPKIFIFNFKAKSYSGYFNGVILANSETEFKKIFKKNYQVQTLINFATQLNKNKNA